MKVERKDPEFRPVVITLESEEELNALWTLANLPPLAVERVVTEELTGANLRSSPSSVATYLCHLWIALNDVS